MNVYIKLLRPMSKSVDCVDFTFGDVKISEDEVENSSGVATALTLRESETNQLVFRCNLNDIETYTAWR